MSSSTQKSQKRYFQLYLYALGTSRVKAHCTELFGVSVSETMAARGLVNGRSLCSRRYHGRWEFTHTFQGALLDIGGIAPQGA